jgi:hypothetical protein
MVDPGSLCLILRDALPYAADAGAFNSEVHAGHRVASMAISV